MCVNLEILFNYLLTFKNIIYQSGLPGNSLNTSYTVSMFNFIINDEFERRQGYFDSIFVSSGQAC